MIPDMTLTGRQIPTAAPTTYIKIQPVIPHQQDLATISQQGPIGNLLGAKAIVWAERIWIF